MPDELALRRTNRDLRTAAAELERHARTLRQIAGEERTGAPVAPVELTEDEFTYLIDRILAHETDPSQEEAGVRHGVWAKLDRVLYMETGPGGHFGYTGDAA